MESRKKRCFGLFPYLHDELKVTILSYVADAPLTARPYPRSSLTHQLPLVSKKFRQFSQSDYFWREALCTLAKQEPALLREALRRLCGEKKVPPTTNNDDTEESWSNLIDRALAFQDLNSCKSLYQEVINQHWRWSGPVFYLPGQIILGEPYSLHLVEPRHRWMIADVMRDHPVEARRGGAIRKDAVFVHANRAPLAPATPAVLAQVLRCHIHPDGRADVTVVPTAHVWLERLWTRPDHRAAFGGRHRLRFAQTLRMGATACRDMDRLARQEALVHVMDMLAGELYQEGDEEAFFDAELELPSDEEYDSEHSGGELDEDN
jgi:hypothetical protein